MATKTEGLFIKLTSNEKARIRQGAQAAGVTVSDYIRRLAGCRIGATRTELDAAETEAMGAYPEAYGRV